MRCSLVEGGRFRGSMGSGHQDTWAPGVGQGHQWMETRLSPVRVGIRGLVGGSTLAEEGGTQSLMGSKHWWMERRLKKKKRR